MSGYEWVKALAKACGLSVTELLAMTRENDPFFTGTPTHRAMAEWFAELWERFGYTHGVHLRRVHYRLVQQEDAPRRADGEPYLNTEACWAHLKNAGKYARILGLVDPEAFEDRRNPDPRIYMMPDEGEDVGWWAEPVQWRLPSIQTNLVDDLADIEAPYLSPTGYEYHHLLQPYHVEVWVEKSTMEDVLLPLCQRYATNLVTGAGDMSMTSVIAMLRRVAELEKPVRILYISDYDPKGVGMPVGVSRKVEFWRQKYVPNSDIKLHPVILTAEQVAHYTDPPLPRIPIKDTDRGKANFEARHGRGAIELDALEGLYPGEFARIVGERIAEFRDTALSRRVLGVRWQASEALRHALEAEAGEYLEEMENIKEEAGEILARYQQPLEDLRSRLEAELAPLRERLEAACQGTQDALDTLDPELPELPAPQVKPETDGWLFDGDRDYLTQLKHYRNYQKRD